MPVTSNMQQTEIRLEIPFMSRKKFRAKHIVVLGSSMRLGPGMNKVTLSIVLSDTPTPYVDHALYSYFPFV